MAVFLGMSSVQGVGDAHPGQSLHFWMQTCEAGKERACAYTTGMAAIYCNDGSGWACNEWGVLQRQRSLPVGEVFQRGCELGYDPACENARSAARDPAMLARGEPQERDLPIVLRGAKPPLVDADPATLRSLGCRQGWPEMCEGERVSGT